jgi:spore maturation protein CgeB
MSLLRRLIEVEYKRAIVARVWDDVVEYGLLHHTTAWLEQICAQPWSKLIFFKVDSIVYTIIFLRVPQEEVSP